MFDSNYDDWMERYINGEYEEPEEVEEISSGPPKCSYCIDEATRIFWPKQGLPEPVCDDHYDIQQYSNVNIAEKEERDFIISRMENALEELEWAHMAACEAKLHRKDVMEAFRSELIDVMSSLLELSDALYEAEENNSESKDNVEAEEHE